MTFIIPACFPLSRWVTGISWISKRPWMLRNNIQPAYHTHRHTVCPVPHVLQLQLYNYSQTWLFPQVYSQGNTNKRPHSAETGPQTWWVCRTRRGLPSWQMAPPRKLLCPHMPAPHMSSYASSPPRHTQAQAGESYSTPSDSTKMEWESQHQQIHQETKD